MEFVKSRVQPVANFMKAYSRLSILRGADVETQENVRKWWADVGLTMPSRHFLAPLKVSDAGHDSVFVDLRSNSKRCAYTLL